VAVCCSASSDFGASVLPESATRSKLRSAVQHDALGLARHVNVDACAAAKVQVADVWRDLDVVVRGITLLGNTMRSGTATASAQCAGKALVSATTRSAATANCWIFISLLSLNSLTKFGTGTFVNIRRQKIPGSSAIYSGRRAVAACHATSTSCSRVDRCQP